MMKTNIIYQGRCQDVMKDFPDDCISLTVTSPPYDSLREYSGFADSFDFDPIAQELFRVTKPGGVVVWVVGDATVNGSETGTSFRQALRFMEIGFNLHDTMIWEKQTFTATGALKVRYAQVFEYMFIFSKGKVKTFNPIKDRQPKGIRKKSGTIRQTNGTTKPQSSLGKVCSEKPGQRFNVWRINSEMSNLNRFHPAQFPEALAADHIKSWSNEGDLIFDPMCGSGTTCLMAKKLNRNYIGIDVNPTYVGVATRRLEQLF